MKTVVIVACLLSALAANAQPTPVPERNLESELSTKLNKAVSPEALHVKPNEIVSGRVTYSGIAVELAKTHNPLQLVNPLAPAKYGSPEDNVLPDTFREPVVNNAPGPLSARVFGWKIFSISF